MAITTATVTVKKIKVCNDAPPPIFDLEDNERFTDIMGESVSVEVRGERAYDKLWFRMNDLDNMVASDAETAATDSRYEKGFHSGTFDLKCAGAKRAESVAFLTYAGLLKTMFGSGSAVALRFQRWTAKRMFAVHFGSQEDKAELAAEMLGVPVGMLKAFMHANFNTTQMGRLSDLEGRLSHEMKISQQLKQQMEIQEAHRKEMITMLNTIISEKSAMIGEKNQRIKELNGMLDMYRSIQFSSTDNNHDGVGNS